jgi:5-formyltetrahydrofolate cyclo-ligase
MMDKQSLRGDLRARRRQLLPEQQMAAAEGVYRALLGFEPFLQAQRVMAYIACRGELSLAPAIDHVLFQGKTLLLPRCDAPGEMTARRVQSLHELQPGAYGLMEPAESSEIMPPERIDLILVPGAAFDRRGGRIGQGGGYYDRFLGKTDALRVGVCHSFALLDAVPKEAHDMRMDFVLTPQGIVRCE